MTSATCACRFILFAAVGLLAGCASFGEGLTRALLAPSEEAAQDTRVCEVSGPAFTGILPMLEQQAGYPALGQAGPDRPILKVIMVHGVGTNVPGYGARLSANLAQALGLSVIAPEAKEFTIEDPSRAKPSASSPSRAIPTLPAIERCCSTS